MWYLISGAKTLYERLLNMNQEPYRQTIFNLASRLAKEGKSEELQTIKSQYEERFPGQMFRFNGQIMVSYIARQVKFSFFVQLFVTEFLNQSLVRGCPLTNFFLQIPLLLSSSCKLQ